MINILPESFGTTKDGRPVTRYTMVNSNGVGVRILSYACAVQSIFVPDKNGDFRDVVLGYSSIEGYETGTACHGSFVGRCANRIKDAQFTLNGKTYHLEQNDGKNHLHGALTRRVYNSYTDGDAVVFRFISHPSEEGYPGILSVELRYRLTEDNALEIEYRATSDEDTVINLTNHTYFNLSGDGSDILDHILRLDADRFTEVNSETLPTGNILSVDATPLDFRTAKPIGRDIFADEEQLRLCRGYDHNFILNKENGECKLFAEAVSPKTGITLSAYTTEPGVQLYTGNFLDTDAAPSGKNRTRYPRYGGFALEAQHYPDSPNHPEFPSVVLKKGEKYYQKTVYRFSVTAE
jgi:aldose 1-epimerase